MIKTDQMTTKSSVNAFGEKGKALYNLDICVLMIDYPHFPSSLFLMTINHEILSAYYQIMGIAASTA